MHTVPLRAEGRGQISGTVVAEPVAVREAEAPVVTSPTRNLPTSKFGSLGRRRRRGALTVLSALLLGLLLLLFLPTLNGDETAASKGPAPNAAGQQEPSEERPAGAGSDEADGESGADQDNVAATDAAPLRSRPPQRRRAPRIQATPPTTAAASRTSLAVPSRRPPESSPRPA